MGGIRMNLLTLNQFALKFGDAGTFAPFSSEAWAFAGQVTLLGMAMIFSVLAILWGVLAIFKLIFAGKTPKEPKAPREPKATARKTAEAEPIPDDVMTAVLAASIQAYEEDQARNDTALIAILTAAVAAYRAEEGTDGGFRVVSFKRAGSGRAWNAKK